MNKCRLTCLGVLVLAGMMVLSATTHAASVAVREYVVAQEDAAADDQNPGTLEKPFKSLRGALKAIADRLQPGDTIWVRNGVYRESVELKAHPKGLGEFVIASGDGYGRMITLAAFPGEQPVIKGSDEVTGWEPYQGSIWVRTNWTVNSQQVFSDDVLLQQIGGKMASGFLTDSWGSPYPGKGIEDMIAGSFFYDLSTKRLYVWLPDGSDPNQHHMEIAVRESLISVDEGLSYIRISGLTLRHGNNYGMGTAVGVAGSHCVVEDVDQAWHAFSGAFVGGDYITFNRCRFNHNGNTGMNGRRRGHRILNCETSYNNYRNWASEWHAGGVKFIPYCQDWVVAGHVAASNNGDGIWFDSSMSGVTIEGCRSFRNRGHGIHYEIGSRGIIKNNLVYENAMRGIYLSNSSDTLVANNLCYRNGMSGIVSIGVKRPVSDVYNRGPDHVMPGGRNLIIGNILVDNCWDPVRNPVFGKKYETWGNRPELILPSDTEANAGCESDYNIFYRSGARGESSRLPFGRDWDIGFAHGLDEWRKKTGWDQHSVFARPLFVDEEARDFHPTENSPAVWFVKKPDMSVFYDIEGKLRPGYKVPLTAGPYGGEPEWMERQRTQPSTEIYAFFPLAGEYPNRDVLWWHIMELKLVLRKELGLRYLTPLVQGFDLQGTPFILNDYQDIMLGPGQSTASVACGAALSDLNFLLIAVKNGAQPILQADIEREDGVTITLKWTVDASGVPLVDPTGAATTVAAWQGEAPLLKNNVRVPVQARLFVTRWKNDNPWLPVRAVKFKLLDPEGQAAVLGLTGTRTPK